jgi:hypothetical protein
VPVRTSRKSYCGSIALRSCLLSECALKVFSCRNPSKLNAALRYQTAGRAFPVHCISDPKRSGASFEESSRRRCVSDITPPVQRARAPDCGDGGRRLYQGSRAAVRAHPDVTIFAATLTSALHSTIASGGGCQAQGAQRIPAHQQDFNWRRRFRRGDVRLSHCRGILPVKRHATKPAPRPNL